MATNMPEVKNCDVSECSYNTGNSCHAIAITVGNSAHAKCDTFFVASHKGGMKDLTGGVGACRQVGCRFNTDLECGYSSGITVGLHESHADCMTFSRK